jgi:catechol 2,3-dioxygenase-like lactoylglutathione lyase family enzyme
MSACPACRAVSSSRCISTQRRLTGLSPTGPRPGSSRLAARVMASARAVAFAAATDLNRARTFYEQTLGLPVVEQNDFACVLDANGTMLRVTAVPEVSRPGYTVLGWKVADINAAARDLIANGVVFLRYDSMDQDEDGVWKTPGGDKVAWFSDPDGNVLSLTQFR